MSETPTPDTLRQIAGWLLLDELPADQADQCGSIAVSKLLREAADTLAALTAENNRLLTVLREVSEYLDGSNYATDSGDLPDTVRAALAPTEVPQR